MSSESLKSYYDFSQFSQAAYTTLSPGTPSVSALVGTEFSQILAEAFSSQYTVLNQRTEGNFSATLFEIPGSNGQPGQKVLAIRGTDGFLDAVTDLNILFGTGGIFDSQYDALKRYYADLANPDGLNLLGTAEKVIVTGHSLGGYLAQTFTADSNYSDNVLHAYTYNAPGFGGIWSEIAELLGVFPESTPSTQITNLFAENGLSATAGLGELVGAVQNIFIEEGSATHNHSIVTLTDALAMYDLFGRVDSTLTVSPVTDILNAVATAGQGSLEQALFDLRKLFQSPPGSLTPDTPLVSGDATANQRKGVRNLFLDGPMPVR